MTKLVWFSDGRRFLGPYDPAEVGAQQDGKRWLRDGDPAVSVFRIEAEDELDARRRMRLHQQAERRAEREGQRPTSRGK